MAKIKTKQLKSQVVKLSLPPIFIFEDHSLPDASELIERMIPFLEEMGYGTFGLELSEKGCLSDEIKQFENDLQQRKQKLEPYEALVQSGGSVSYDSINDTYREALVFQIKINLLHRIKYSRMHYKGIDMCEEDQRKYSDSAIRHSHREHKMGPNALKLIFQYNGGAFFLMGAKHRKGFENWFIESGFEWILERSIFLEPHSLKSSYRPLFPNLSRVLDPLYQNWVMTDPIRSSVLNLRRTSAIDCGRKGYLESIKSQIEAKIDREPRLPSESKVSTSSRKFRRLPLTALWTILFSEIVENKQEGPTSLFNFMEKNTKDILSLPTQFVAGNQKYSLFHYLGIFNRLAPSSKITHKGVCELIENEKKTLQPSPQLN